MNLPAGATAWLAENPAITVARTRAHQAGIATVGADVGSLLRGLAQLVRARTAVETATDGGVAGLWLLAGMRPDGVLTSINADPEHQRLGRQAFNEAGVATSRARLITGIAGEVLPRLTDGGYDVVHLDCGASELAAQFDQAKRLVRTGGVIVVTGLFRDPKENGRGARTLFELVGTEGPWWPTMLPAGDGVLILTTAT